MSTLTENVQKVKNAHAALKTAIEGKGVTVPAGTKLTGMPALVDQIQTGGGGGQDYGYLTFTAGSSASKLKLGQNGSIEPLSLLKSTDAQNWTKWENPSSNWISLQAGESVYIKADEDASTRTATDSSNYNHFYMTGAIACTGDPTALIKLVAPADYQYCFAYLFKGCTSLKKTPELPSTTLTESCYSDMFNGCTSLTTAPELHATTAAKSCCNNMFFKCSALTEAPALQAVKLAETCYSGMFYHCTSLTAAPELPATTLAKLCYGSMFDGCTSLEQAPTLPAKNLAESCYGSMFIGCTSLKRIKMNASSGSWGAHMFNGCEALELVDMTGSTGVPTLQSLDNFQGTSGFYKVVVPDSLYDTWIAATNWASIASHIMKQSDWNAAHTNDQL